MISIFVYFHTSMVLCFLRRSPQKKQKREYAPLCDKIKKERSFKKIRGIWKSFESITLKAMQQIQISLGLKHLITLKLLPLIQVIITSYNKISSSIIAKSLWEKHQSRITTRRTSFPLNTTFSRSFAQIHSSAVTKYDCFC